MAEIKSIIDKNAKIAVLCGGMSSEAEVSRRSGKGCYEALKRLGYVNAKLVEVDKNIAQTLKEGNFDYAYNALHGKYGEDGCIQGVLEILGIPYTGCGVMSSSICMNKEYTKRILSTCNGSPMAKSAFVQKGENLEQKTADLKFPVITKPVSEGSSFGMTKVNKREDAEDICSDVFLKVQKKLSDGKDIGYVGEVVETDSSVIDSLLDADFIPVVAPIGMGMDDDHDYNINADDCACAVATAINAEKLVFLTDIEGVFTDPSDKKTLISEMTLDEAQQLIDEGVVGGGMLPKLQNCIDAMNNGVSRVHILDGRLEHCLLLEFYTEKGIGTAILNDEAK